MEVTEQVSEEPNRLLFTRTLTRCRFVGWSDESALPDSSMILEWWSSPNRLYTPFQTYSLSYTGCATSVLSVLGPSFFPRHSSSVSNSRLLSDSVRRRPLFLSSDALYSRSDSLCLPRSSSLLFVLVRRSPVRVLLVGCSPFQFRTSHVRLAFVYIDHAAKVRR